MKKNGFTLIEMMLVVIIMGVLAAMVCNAYVIAGVLQIERQGFHKISSVVYNQHFISSHKLPFGRLFFSLCIKIKKATLL